MNYLNERPQRRQTDLVDSMIGSEVLRYAMAILLGLTSLIVWLWAGSIGVTRPFLSFFLAVVPISVGCGVAFGWRAGLIGSACASLMGLYLILPPRFSLAFMDDAELAFFSAVVIGTGFASYLVGARRTLPGRR